ncbi:hypothetical protein F4679DRAFT_531527 [Xylaria curta]|nr:hypothetical protein F4679DRAFT_531527 [Xylaria curta]
MCEYGIRNSSVDYMNTGLCITFLYRSTVSTMQSSRNADQRRNPKRPLYVNIRRWACLLLSKENPPSPSLLISFVRSSVLLGCSSSISKIPISATMAKFLATLLAAAALLQVGIAAPFYPPTNVTVDVKARHYNTTFLPVLHTREIRTFPIALQRP